MLLQKYHRAWLGALAPVIAHEGMVFERGFLESCVMRTGNAPVGDPLWSTVRAVELPWYSPKGFFLAHPAMRSLRHVRGINFETLVHLATRDHPVTIESITCVARADYGGAYSAEAEALIAESPSLPSLRSLDLWVLSGDWPSPRLLDGELGRRLETLALRLSGYHARPLAPWLHAVRERELPLAHLHLDFYKQLETSLERSFDGRLSSLAARVYPRDVLELPRFFLADLHDGDLSRARIYTGGKLTPAQRGELRGELRDRFPSLKIDFV